MSTLSILQLNSKKVSTSGMSLILSELKLTLFPDSLRNVLHVGD